MSATSRRFARSFSTARSHRLAPSDQEIFRAASVLSRFTPNVPADPSLIDLNIVGSFALDASTKDIIGDSATGPIGISAATTTVPEPSTLVLTLLGALGLGAVRGRRRR
jgi:hypothetical protein